MTEWLPWALCAALAFACAYFFALWTREHVRADVSQAQVAAHERLHKEAAAGLARAYSEWQQERAGLIVRLEALHDRLMATDWPSYWQARAQDRMIEAESHSRQGEHADAEPQAPFDAVDPLGRPVTGVRREQVDGYDE